MNSVFKTRLAIAALLLCSSFYVLNTVVANVAQQDSPTKYVLIINLDSNKIETLRRTGVLTANIPPKMINKINAIRFKRKTSFLTKSLETKAPIDKVNSDLLAVIDNTVIERLDYQPVEVKIFESGFNRLFIKFNPKGNVAGEIPKQIKVERRPEDSQFVYVRLDNQRGLYGTLKGLSKFPVKTGFGDVEIPSKQLKGIRLNTDDKGSAHVMLHSGDEFTATIADQKITINSWWGPQEVKLSEIESITTSKEQKFIGAKDGKWKLQSGPQRSGLNRNPIQRPTFK